MIIGEIVERLIGIRDNNTLLRAEDDAVCAACNLLDTLPRLTESDEVEKQLKTLFDRCE